MILTGTTNPGQSNYNEVVLYIPKGLELEHHHQM